MPLLLMFTCRLSERSDIYLDEGRLCFYDACLLIYLTAKLPKKFEWIFFWSKFLIRFWWQFRSWSSRGISSQCRREESEVRFVLSDCCAYLSVRCTCSGAHVCGVVSSGSWRRCYAVSRWCLNAVMKIGYCVIQRWQRMPVWQHRPLTVTHRCHCRHVREWKYPHT